MLRLPAVLLPWGLLLSRAGVAHLPAVRAACSWSGALLVGEQPTPLQRAGSAAGGGVSPSVVFQVRKAVLVPLKAGSV